MKRSRFTEEQIIHCAAGGHVAGRAVPQARPITELPKNNYGNILKSELREILGTG